MESFKSSSATDFQFKHIPKKRFEEMVTRVRQERRDKGMWGSFCSVTSGNDEEDIEVDRKTKVVKATRTLAEDEVQSFVSSISKSASGRRSISPREAPFFGPARNYAETLRKEQEHSKPSTSSSDASTIPSVHIAEVVHVYPQTSEIKIQVQNQNDNESKYSLVEDDKESLESELLKLCSEIENANGVAASGSSPDLTYQDEKTLQNIIDKTEEKVICEKYNKFIDKKFDFLFDEECDEDENAVQALPVVELRKKAAKKVRPDGDCTNENNVWIPPAENQIRKSGRRQESETAGARKKKNDDVFPSDVIIRKVSEAGKLKRDVNEKSQGDVKTVDETKRKAMDDIVAALGRVSELQSKICKYLDYLREIIEDPPEVEDMSDLKKRQQRATEFSNRFARNHLYQIGRLAEEISVMHDNPGDLASKVIQLFQVITQGLQIYLKNVEMFIYNKYPDKLSILINFIINAVTICLERLIFDKRDAAIQQLLRKCSDMKKYLEMNQESLAKFSSIRDNRKMSLHARNSFAYENNYGTKLTMYDVRPPRPMKQILPAKSPYDAVKSPYDAMVPRNLKSSRSNVTSKQKPPLSRLQSRTQSRVKSPMLKKSSSCVSTAMQRMRDSESKEIIKTKSEKPFEENDSRGKEMEIMEMMQNIAKEKIQEMLAPLLSELKKSLPSDKLVMPRSISPLPRVTSEVEKPEKKKVSEPEKPKSFEKVENVSKNVQYLYVKSNEEKQPQSKLQPSASKAKLSQSNSETPSSNQQKAREVKVVKLKAKPPMPVDKKDEEAFTKQLKEEALKERLEYVKQMMESPMYVNESYNQPWEVFAGISDKLVDEMLQSIVAGLDFGEKTFVESFLRHELNC